MMFTSLHKPEPADFSTSVGEERFKSDKRQFAGLMFALAVNVTFQV